MRPNCARLGGATVESKRSNGAAIAPERSGGTSGFPRPSPHGEYCGHLVKQLLPPERQKLQSQRDIDDYAHQATRRRVAVTSRDDGPQLGIFLWGAAMIIFWIALAFCFFLERSSRHERASLSTSQGFDDCLRDRNSSKSLRVSSSSVGSTSAIPVG